MWLKERPFLGSPGGFACAAFTARAVSDQLRKVAHWRPERLLPYGNAAWEPGQERCDQLRKVAKWRPEQLLP
jgi:hypothetical protein